jgi:2-dehydropantoate 2-reductase
MPDVDVVAGRVHGFFEIEENGVRHVGVEPSLQLGSIGPRGDAAAMRIAATLDGAGVKASVSDDIRRDLWEKFVLASSIGAVAPALGATAGTIDKRRGGRALLSAVMSEIADLGRTLGVVLPEDCVEQTMRFVATFPSDATSSLQRDLEAHRTSEYDALTGAALRMAQASGLPVPSLKKVESMLRSRGYLSD